MSRSPSESVVSASSPDPRRWKALGVLGLIQFILILDISVVNVALPHIQRDLGFSRSGLAWVVNGYVLMAGGFLLLGGRLADIFGRRRVFLLGVGLFAVASATCGAAGSPGMLVASRFVQGAGEAMAGPASVGLIALLFPDPVERMKALGIWGGLAALGGTTGSVISGVLTDAASWRWIFYVNLPVALIALIAVPRLVSESRMVRKPGRPDYAGAICGTSALVAVVYGLLAAASHPWSSSNVLVPLACGICLIAATILIETHASDPLIPLQVFANRTRSTTNVVSLFSAAAFFSYFFLLTLFEQQILDYSPLTSGLSYLPFGLSIGVGIGLSTSLMPKLGVRPLMAIGFFASGAGLLLTSSIDIHASYAGSVLPGMIVLGIGSGLTFPTINNAALHQVTGQDASLASGVQSASQAIGGALGLACLVSLALRHAANQAHNGVALAAASTDGYVLAFRCGAVLLILAGIAVMTLLEQVSARPRNAAAEVDAVVPAEA